MASSVERLKDETYLNWLRDSLGLLFLKESLEDIMDKRVVDFHNELHKTVPQPYSRNGPILQSQPQMQPSPCVQICKQCTYKDIQRHHRGWRARCSSGVCCEWLKYIIKSHVGQPDPNIACTNLKPQLWPSHPWEVAKCFLPLGCENVTAAKDTDIASILKLLNTCVFMLKFIKDIYLIEEVLDIRHRLMHSNTLAVSDDQLKSDTDKMIQLFRNLEHLSPTETQTVQKTINNINKLQSKTMDITLNSEVIALKSRMQDVDRELVSLNDKYDGLQKTRQNLNTTATDLKSLEEDSKKTRQNLNTTAADLKTLEEDCAKTKLEIKQLRASQDRLKEFLEKHDLVQDISRLSSRSEDHETRIHHLEEVISERDTHVVGNVRSWEDQCKEVQQTLLSHYKTTCLVVQIPSESNYIGLEYLYVDPAVRVVRESKGRDGLKNIKNDAACLTWRKIFYTEDYLCKQIYITGVAGCGKTMLCKNIVKLWCEGHGLCLSNESEESDSDEEAFGPFYSKEQRKQARKQRHEERKAIRKENRDILSQFTLLFYITLRDSLSEYSVSDMIHSQILKYHESIKGLSASVLLQNECCLVIVDGLDEWVCPAGARVPPFLSSEIPGRDIFNQNNVFLTTTRPWKLDILELKEIDKHVELCSLNEQSASRICSKLIKLFNKSKMCSKTKYEFFRTLKQKGLDHFKTIPAILIQLVCLWFDNQELGRSQVQLYCAMLDLLLKKSQKNLSVQTTNIPTSVASETPLPKCIIEHPYCQDHQQLIYCISRVAFEALFDKRKENSLVFKSSQLEICGVGQTSINMCLMSGILSQNKVLEKCFVSKLSFLHKKFQEFLAAIFLVSCDNVQDVLKHITDFCNTLDTCLEMSQVWMFVSGIRPDITRQLLDHLTCVVTTDQKVKHYRQTLDGEGLIQAIQTCVTDCVIEGGNNGHIYDNIMLEDFYIDRNTACHVERLLSCTPRSKVKSVYIQTRDIGDSQLTSITSQLEQCHSVQKLHLYDPWSSRIDSDTVAQIVNNNNLGTLTCLDLYSRITATAELVSDICSISSKCLMALKLWNVRLTHEHIEQILTRLPQSPTIRQLVLWLHCTDHGDCCQTSRIDLSTMTHIQRLELWFMSVDNLQSVSHCVEHVRLWFVILPVTTLCEFARRLSQTRRDVTVQLWGVTVTEVRERRVDVETFLRTCHGLKVTRCQYDDSDNTWDIHFTTSSQ